MKNTRFTAAMLFILMMPFIALAETAVSGKFLFLGFDYNPETVSSSIFDETRDREIAGKIQMITGVPAYHIDYVVSDSLKAFSAQWPIDIQPIMETVYSSNPSKVLSTLKSNLKVVLNESYREILKIGTASSFYTEEYISYIKNKIQAELSETLLNRIESGELRADSSEVLDSLLSSAVLNVKKGYGNNYIQYKELYDTLGITATLKVNIKTESRNTLKDPRLYELFQDKLDKLYTEYDSNIEKLRTQKKEDNLSINMEKDATEAALNKMKTEYPPLIAKNEKILKSPKTTQKEYRQARERNNNMNNEIRKSEKKTEELKKKLEESNKKYAALKKQNEDQYRSNKQNLEKEINKEMQRMAKEKKALAAVDKTISIEYNMNYFFYPEIEYISYVSSPDGTQINRDMSENKSPTPETIFSYLPYSITRYIFDDWKTFGITGISKKAKKRVIDQRKLSGQYIEPAAAILSFLPGYGAGCFMLSRDMDIINSVLSTNISKTTMISLGCVSLLTMITGNALMFAGIGTAAYYYKSENINNPSNILFGIMLPFYAISIGINIYSFCLFLNVRFVSSEDIYFKNINKEMRNYSKSTEISVSFKF